MEETCSTENERISSRPSTPFRASSIGIVMSSSTSVEVLPIASVWTSTIGGANSGKTSIFASRVWRKPKTRMAAAAKIASQRKRRLRATIQRITACPRSSRVLVEDLVLGREQLGRSDRHDRGPGRRPLIQERPVAALDDNLDGLPDVGLWLGPRIDEDLAVRVVDQRGMRHHLACPLPADRRGLEVDPRRGAVLDADDLDVGALDRLQLVGLVLDEVGVDLR